MKRLFILLILVSGCSSYNVQRYQAIDALEKTVAVPPGGQNLTGAIKDVFVKAGWKLIVYGRGPAITQGEMGQTVDLKQFDTFNARYNLVVRWQQTDICVLGLDPKLNYDISLIDNKNGQEVLTMSGLGCQSKIAESFSQELNKK